MIDPAWAAVASGVGASILTGGFSWGLNERQSRRQGRASKQQEKTKAYGQLLFYSQAIVFRAAGLREAMHLRSGLKEGLDVTFHHRKPVDPMELYDWMDKDLGPLHEAWSEVWGVGSQEAIVAADRLVSACGEFTSSAASLNPEGGWLAKLIKGEVWSEEQKKAYDAALKELARARVDFAKVMRVELGNPLVEFSLERVEREQAAIDGGSE